MEASPRNANVGSIVGCALGEDVVGDAVVNPRGVGDSVAWRVGNDVGGNVGGVGRSVELASNVGVGVDQSHVPNDVHTHET